MVFRRQVKKEKYALKDVRKKVKQDGISQMIWACFVGNTLGPIAFVDGALNQDAYFGILNQYLIPFIDALSADGEMNLKVPTRQCQTSYR